MFGNVFHTVMLCAQHALLFQDVVRGKLFTFGSVHHHTAQRDGFEQIWSVSGGQLNQDGAPTSPQQMYLVDVELVADVFGDANKIGDVLGDGQGVEKHGFGVRRVVLPLNVLVARL